MRRILFALIAVLVLTLVISCGRQKNAENSKEAENLIVQNDDGSVFLKLEQAERYSDAADPSGNTAEWRVVISKPGRYTVWLTSATRDTMDLKYANTVIVSLADNQLEVDPVCNKLSENKSNVPEAYFMTDSYVGSFFIPDSGEYSIQVISEKVIARNMEKERSRLSDDTMLISLMLSPATR